LQKGIWYKETNLEIIDNGEGKWAFVTREVDYQNKNTISAISINDISRQFSLKNLDIVKIDIEGSEKVVFSNNYDEWLGKTKLVIIELHDKLEHGTSHAFFNAMRNYDYTMDIKGENIFCRL
jgi:FkbM family methyltransferase